MPVNERFPGAPIRMSEPMYQCATCGALVCGTGMETHHSWHIKAAQAGAALSALVQATNDR